MKLVKEILYENNYMSFTETGDPVNDMGIGAKKSIENWLDSMNIDEYKLTKKFLINVYKSVLLDHKNLNNLPDYIIFNHIMGGFHISNNNLISLQGVPYSVSGSFMCSNNKLTTLKFSPRIVKESYGASHNQLETLQGIAEIITGSIYINDNNLTDLKYIPRRVTGDLHIFNNPIQSLKHFPGEVTGNILFTESEYLTKEIITRGCKIGGMLISIEK